MNILSDLAIGKFINSTFIYNITVEDTDIDRKYLKIGNRDRIFTISGAGDHVLQYLIDDPSLVVCCDINIHQLFLLELKISCMKVLDREEYFSIFGQNNHHLFLKYYHSQIRNLLSEKAMIYWDENNEILRNFIYAGSQGKFFYLLDYIVKHNYPYLKELKLKLVANDKNVGDYIRSYRKKIVGEIAQIGDKFFYIFISAAGIPGNQIKWLKGRNVQKIIEDVFDPIMQDPDNFLKRNYLINWIFKGFMTEDCCLPYMKRGVYELVKSRLDRIEIQHGSVKEVIQRYRDPFTIYIPLDHWDWLDSRSLHQEVHVVSSQMRGRGKVLFRTFHPVELGAFNSFLLRYNVQYIHEEWDIFPFYLGIGLFEFEDVHRFSELEKPGSDLGILPIIPHCLKHIFNRGQGNEGDVISFYDNQKDVYDQTRKYLIKRREELINALPRTPGGDWLEMCSGTGISLDFMGSELSKFNSIDLLDLSSSLCSVAQERVRKTGLKTIQVHNQSIFQFNTSKRYDIITISYGLSMIEEYEKVIRMAYYLLKPGGKFYIVDFYKSNQFWKHYFSLNNVYLNEDYLGVANKFFKMIFFDVVEERLAMTPFTLPYYIWVGQKVL